MPSSTALQIGQRRSLLSCLGTGAGLVLWLLSENWDNTNLSPALYLALLSFCGSYAGLALALVGPVSVRRALSGALILALPFAGLVSLAGLRYDLATRVLDQPVLVSVSLLWLLISTPFLSVTLQDRRAWRDYSALFEAAWALTIRYLLAWVFVGLFWLLVALSNALLALVDIDILERIFDTDWLIFALTGGVLGLAMAVVFELSNTGSPFLVLRLLRLLAVPVVVVVAIFLAAIPLRGLSKVFGDFSAAATLMGVAMVMITLVAVVLERDDARMRKSFTISISTQLMAALLPLVTGLAAWAIWLRVSDYGWTPDRVLAACVSAVLLVYGLLYALAVLRRQDWSARIRHANVGLALVTVAISTALLTPLMNADRISANSQVQRYLDGRLSVNDLPLWHLKHDWGRAGQAALVALEDSPKGELPEVVARFQDLRDANSPWAFERGSVADKRENAKAELVDLVPVRPAGQKLTVDDLEGLGEYELDLWLAGCRLRLSDGRPGCVLIMDQFDLKSTRQGMVLYRNSKSLLTVETSFLTVDYQGQAVLNNVQVFEGETRPRLNTVTIEQILDGQYSVGPSSLRALHVGGREMLPRP